MFRTKTALAVAPVALLIGFGDGVCAPAAETAPLFAAIAKQDAATVTSLLDAHPDWANAKKANPMQRKIRSTLWVVV